MTVFVDSNVLFDVVGRRQPHYAASNQLLALCRRRALTGAVGMPSLANLFYEYGKPVLPFIRERLLVYFSVHGADAALIETVLAAGFKDFEDALQAAAAQTSGAAFIVTRNVKDFKFSRVPAMTPADFLARFHPEN
jgi:predicted nucleic acid-binding protein